MSDGFYVGYRKTAPPDLARWLRPRLVLLCVLVAATALAVVAAQRPFASSVFEFGEVRTYTGRIALTPYPVLEVARDHATDEDAAGPAPVSRWLLVAPFKFGLDARAFDGRDVTLRGTLIYRDSRTMLEVEPDSITPVGNAAAIPPGGEGDVLGTRTLVGEIVDSKCFLGVMNPGNLKPHRACAVRCISGGIPPVLVVTDTRGRATYYLLTDADGGAVNHDVLDLVAEPVEITGEVRRLGDLLLLRADPATYRRVE